MAHRYGTFFLKLRWISLYIACGKMGVSFRLIREFDLYLISGIYLLGLLFFHFVSKLRPCSKISLFFNYSSFIIIPLPYLLSSLFSPSLFEPRILVMFYMTEAALFLLSLLVYAGIATCCSYFSSRLEKSQDGVQEKISEMARITSHTKPSKNPSCAICLRNNKYPSWTNLSCTHSFHTVCLETGIAYGHLHCPLCRRKLKLPIMSR